ncbi:MAG: TIGR01212 family radical SAM protein [Eubacterium sp.]|nr:TIGR01212 family radical SAM protein [Eubacterium sp.]
MKNSRRIWGEKPYHSFDYELKKRFGEKIYKVSLAGGRTCPNRDGTLDTRGCIFCSSSGSGDFASPACESVTRQIDRGIMGISSRKKVGSHFIAYFQSFTSTYAPVSTLRPMFMEAISHPSVVMLAIGTRPDCLPDDVMALLQECNQIKPVIVELGLQTIHEDTARYIRRHYPLSVYDEAVARLQAAGIEVVTHVIAGLPGETKEDFLQTVSHVAAVHCDGIKLQLLHVLKQTDMATDYEKNLFQTLTMEEYLDWILDAISILPPEMVIHRLTGDGPKDLLIAPLWSSRKREVLNTLHKKLKEKQIWQGKDCQSYGK